MPRALCHYAKTIYKQKSLPLGKETFLHKVIFERVVSIHEEHINNIAYKFWDLLKKPYLDVIGMESFWWQFLKRGAFSNCHILSLFASATKRNVKIQLHVCNLHYTKESLGLYRSTFPSNMIISWTQIFLCIKKEEYDCIPLSIDIVPYCGIGRIVHSANLCAYILA